MKNAGLVMAFIAVFAAGTVAGHYWSRGMEDSKPAPKNTAEQSRGKGVLTNPLLDCEEAEGYGGKGNYSDLERGLSGLAGSIKSKNASNHLSVYFRELNNGSWFGVNENEKFTPASLLKVPTMISLYKMAQVDPAVLAAKFPYSGTLSTLPQYYKPESVLEPGKEYTVDELIGRTITYSDNEALELLSRHLSPAVFRKAYMDLGIPMPKPEDENYMTVKDYASFFRVLYNASYLSEDMSERALKLLTQTTYRDGLMSGVPAHTVVAHKFGERSYTDKPGKQLHDCGIVYHPKDPYLLCVMTRGNDFPALSDVIKTVSSQVWAEVDKRTGK